MIKDITGYIISIFLFVALLINGGCDSTSQEKNETSQEHNQSSEEIIKISKEKVKIIKRHIRSASDIVPITDSLVVPYVYTSAVSMNNLPVAEKKQKFFDMMLPAILVAKTRLAINLARVEEISSKEKKNHRDEKFLNELMTKYKATNMEMLKSRLTCFPVSIILSQAAIESAWGTSRFFLEANNPFGLWSFNSKQERITAESTRNGKKIYLRKFNNMDQAIDAYLTTLSTGPYNEFRKQRLKTQDPYVLVDYLIDYSERRKAYVDEVVSVIKGNDLTKYDTYMISPKYIKHRN